MMKMALLPSVWLLAFSLPALSQIEIPAWGAEAYGFVANRPFGAGSSTSNGPFSFTEASGGAGFYSDSADLTEARGSISSSVILTSAGGISIPEIHTYAATTSTSSAASSAVGVEGYLYSGSVTKEFALDVVLTGSFANLDTDFAGNFANISIWSEESGIVAQSSSLAFAAVESSFFFSTSTGNYYEFGFTELDSIALEMNGIADDDVVSGRLSWTMNPGETVYLHAQGTSRAYGPGSVADASHTLSMSFVDSTGLTSLSGGVVPEPGPGSMGALGLGILLILRRR